MVILANKVSWPNECSLSSMETLVWSTEVCRICFLLQFCALCSQQNIQFHGPLVSVDCKTKHFHNNLCVCVCVVYISNKKWSLRSARTLILLYYFIASAVRFDSNVGYFPWACFRFHSRIPLLSNIIYSS